MEKLEEYLAQAAGNSDAPPQLLRDLAYHRIHDGLKHAGLAPGDVLSEVRLSKALNISRTPVREALQKLGKEGLVQVIPGRAVTVAAPSIKEVLDALHVRELLEPEIARMATFSLADDEKKALLQTTRIMEKHAKERNRLEWLRADLRWHEILNRSCPNGLLGQFVTQARNRIYNQGVGEQITDQDIIDGTAEHLQIVEAIIARDADKAQRLMLSHLHHVRQNMFRRLGRD